jgi:HTH-type transcriptional regulator / antitoxin HigA
MAILNQRDYRQAKARIEQLKQAQEAIGILGEMVTGLSTDIADARRIALKEELQRLAGEIDAYEKLRGREIPSAEKIEAVDLGLLPITARIVRGWSQKELAGVLGVKEQQVQRYESERYARISLSRYKRLLEILGVQLQASLGSSQPGDSSLPEFDLSSDLAREIRRRGWLDTPKKANYSEFAKALRDYINNAAQLSEGRSFRRKQLRDNSKFSDASLLAWQARVITQGSLFASRIKGRFNIADVAWLPELVTLSRLPDGPRPAIEYLREKGIVVVLETPLPQTYLDGAAFLLLNGVPVIGLTLRYDRLDYFWFTLFHELGHIYLHFNRGLASGFLDNMDAPTEADYEKEADAFARSTLIPDEAWNSAPARFSKSVDLAKDFATSRGIHVAIVVGRIRQERADYSKYSEWVGQGQVRRLLLKKST